MDDATTATDGGFRVGRRVRVNLEGDRHHGLEGELRWIPGHDEESPWWHIKFGDKPVNPADAFHQSILLLFPEHDAPATPEPPAKTTNRISNGLPMGGRVCSLTDPYQGWHGSIVGVRDKDATLKSEYLIRFDCSTPTFKAEAWKAGEELDYVPSHIKPGQPLGKPPADSKPPYYAALRDADCEPFKVIRGAHSRDWAIGYHVGTAEAYLLRCQRKHPTPDDDIRKAHAHLTEAVAILDGKSA